MHRPLASSAGRHTDRDYDTSPLIVFYEVTRACDLVCLHCRACAQREAAPDELSTWSARALIDEFAGFPVLPLLVLTGGDPFKRRDLADLVRHATQRKLEVAVTPSATPLVTRAALAELQLAGLRRVAVSLDGPDAASHDRFRGVAGSFQRTLEIAKDARDLGLPVQINTTVTPGNWERINEFAELLDGMDIVLWSVFFLVPVGRADNQPRLTAEQVEEVFGRLWQQTRQRRFAIKTTEAPHYRRFVLQQDRAADRASPLGPRNMPSSFATNDGKGILFVSHRGEIYPSGFLPIAAGVFPRDGIVSTYQYSPLFEALREPRRLKGKCSVCKFRNLCGGSRARAYAVTSDPLAAEPDCAYVPTPMVPTSSTSRPGSTGGKLPLLTNCDDSPSSFRRFSSDFRTSAMSKSTIRWHPFVGHGGLHDTDA